MTDPTPNDLATLARAMGYTVTLDDSGNAGVVRVLATKQFDDGKGFQCVFCPHLDAAQAWEVMAWLTKQGVAGYDLLTEYERSPLFQNDGTAAGVHRAVVEEAIRVAKQQLTTPIQQTENNHPFRCVGKVTHGGPFAQIDLTEALFEGTEIFIRTPATTRVNDEPRQPD